MTRFILCGTRWFREFDFWISKLCFNCVFQDLQQLQQLQQQNLNLQQFVLVHPTANLQPAQFIISQTPQGQQGERRRRPCGRTGPSRGASYSSAVAGPGTARQHNRLTALTLTSNSVLGLRKMHLSVKSFTAFPLFSHEGGTESLAKNLNEIFHVNYF